MLQIYTQMELVVHYNHSYTVVIYTKATAAFAGQVDIYIGMACIYMA